MVKKLLLCEYYGPVCTISARNYDMPDKLELPWYYAITCGNIHINDMAYYCASYYTFISINHISAHLHKNADLTSNSTL